jgi:Right handed beta helix region
MRAYLACRLGVSALFAILHSACLHASTFFVSTIGNDRWSGLLQDPTKDGLDGPLRSIEEAQARVRTLVLSPRLRVGPIEVVIRNGTYFTNGLTFTARDSGTENSPIVYRPFKGERVMISGAAVVAPLSADGEYISYLLRGFPIRTLPQLYFDGVRTTSVTFPSGKEDWSRGGIVSPDGSKLRLSDSIPNGDPGNVQNATVELIYNWTSSVIPIVNIRDGGRALDLSGPIARRDGRPQVNRDTLIKIVGLSEPKPPIGRWSQEPGNIVVFHRPDPKVGAPSAYYPLTTHLLVFKGSPSDPVRNITIRDLEFSYSLFDIPKRGWNGRQAETGVPAAIEATYVSGVDIEGVRINHTGGAAIWIGDGSKNVMLRRCTIEDTGAGAILIGQKRRAALRESSGDPQVSGISVQSCSISRTGVILPGAAAIWVGFGDHISIMKNSISETSYTGISIGWSWGFGKSGTSHVQACDNTLTNIGNGLMSDLGGIYTLGVLDQTLICRNNISGVKRLRYGARGIYADEGTSNVTFLANSVADVEDEAFFQHYGSGNVLDGNHFLGEGIVIACGDSRGNELLIKNNTLVSGLETGAIKCSDAILSRLKSWNNIIMSRVPQTLSRGSVQ